MKTNLKLFLLGVLMSMSFMSFSQDWSKVRIDPIKEKKFLPYLELRHAGAEATKKWKEENKYEYVKQMWYFTESFYVKRNHTASGNVLDESLIDVTRFEKERKLDQETVVTLPGFKDAIVLLPSKDCFYIYK
ncbi:MAG: hypothetical protein ACK50A_05870 [Sphingobacteriaceae bacterium]|jgi:hypothetical protein